MKTTRIGFLFLAVVLALSMPGRSPSALAGKNEKFYLPLVFKPNPSGCTGSSGNVYQAGPAMQWDRDNPVRPAALHADKNLGLRGYTTTSGNAGFVDYNSHVPTQPPQLATLFNPNRVPGFTGLFRANNWNWAASPSPGSAGTPVTFPPVTVLGLQTTAGESLRVPTSGHDIGGGMEVIVLYAAADTIALKYTREDSVAPTGYLLHVDNICTDPALLILYNSLDSGARYVFQPTQDANPDYDLPHLPAGKIFGTARGNQIRVAIVDSGAFMDPRSCTDWWQIRPGQNC
jgi:hypothetical protein